MTLSGPPRDYSEPEQPAKPVRSTCYSCLAIAIAGLLLWVGLAYGHQAPTGWRYPFSCCSGMDCRPVPEKAISEQADGYHVPSGEVVGYQDTRLKDSPDGQYHWCSVAGADDGRTICLYVPPRAY